MDKSADGFPLPRRYIYRERRGGGRTILASCALAACFLILVAIALAVVFFVLFRPREPTIQVSAVQLPRFSSGNGTASFNFLQYAAVRNPNRASFSHYDSSLQLIYAGSQVGFMYIPAGEIDGGRTKYMEAGFSVPSFPVAASPAISMVVESRMRVKGRVRVLRFFTHPVEAKAGCRVAVSASDGSVLRFKC
ncbi:hypothetical protein AXF42_Ash001161 [Apostasia shenzhenica]|uniref:Late embryogenesis abundant protein LEA-2 subgroup domain-containing protein n=1 Tax=Apostasia shenzhenica TaxID=1088818 RepID=A0A2I0AU46_9ASPA|nr:hypothetical protein AXF42_Ash001161 [Apostasia shenzhenica]